MFKDAFFSRTATTATGLLLLAVIVWTFWMIGPTAIQRWFG